MNEERDAGLVESLRRRIAELEAARSDLQQSEKALRRQIEFVLGATRTGLDIVDAEFNILYVDPELRRVHGDPAGKKCYEYFLGGSDPCPDCGAKKALESKGPVVTEREVQWEGRRTVQVTSMPYQDERGNWLVAEVAVDITERKRAEEELKQSEERYRVLVDSTEESIFTMNEECVYLFMNATGAERLGGKPEDFIGKTMWDAFPKEIADRQAAGVREVIRTGRGRTTESITVLQGQPRWYRTITQPLRDACGRVVAALIFARDITESKQVEQGLRESESLNRALLNATTERAQLLEPDGTIIAINETSAKSFGGTPDELIGQRLYDLMPPALAETRRARLMEVVRSGVAIHHEDVRDGRIMDAHVYPVFDSEGRVFRLAVYARDVTEQKQAQEALRESEERYRDLFQNAPLCIFEEDLTRSPAVILRANRRAEDTYGWSSREFAGMSVANLIPPEAAEDAGRVGAELQAGRSIFLETLNRRRDGTVFPVRISATVSPAFGLERVIILVEDITERKRIEEALRGSEARYRALVEQLPAVTYVAALDETSTTLYVSPQIEPMLGYSPADYAADPNIWYERLHPDDRQRVTEELRRSRAASASFLSEYRMLRRDGREVWFRDEAVIVRDAEGNGLFLQGVMLDVTKRKRAEEALRESKERLQYVIDSTRDVIFQIDLEGNYTFANKAAESLTGYPLSDLLGESIRKVIAPDHQQAVFDRLRRRIAGEDLEQPYTFDIVHKDGHRVPVELVTTGVFRDERLVAVQGIARDITERHRAEEKLRESEERYRTLVQNLNVGVYRNTGGPHGRFLQANPAIVRMLGYDSVEELMNVQVSDLYATPEDRASYVGKIAKQGFVNAEEIRVKRKDGTAIWTSVTAKVQYDADGGIKWMDGILEDITERKRAEEALRAAQHKLTAAREEERRALAAELHDSIGQGLIVLQLALRGAAPGGESIADPRVHADAEKQLSKLIQDVRQISHGLYPPTLESLGLVAALRELCGMSGAIQKSCRIHCPASLEKARLGDEVEIALFRIAQEAVHNAVRHSRAERIEVRLAYKDGQATLRVTDEGVGFDPGEVVGKGLGLTTMRERADGIGGRLRISSRPGRTCVEVRVPATIRERAARAGSRARKSRPNRRNRKG